MEIDSLSGRNRDLEARITALSDGEGAQEESGQTVSTVVSGDQDKRMRVLMLKEKALELKEYYLGLAERKRGEIDETGK